MLVLSRKRDEKIVIGNGIVLTVVDIRGDKVRLGIEAPSNVPIHRQEVLDRLIEQGIITLPVPVAEAATDAPT